MFIHICLPPKTKLYVSEIFIIKISKISLVINRIYCEVWAKHM